MANEKNYVFFKLIEGNIAESRAEAIVVPCFMDFTPATQISNAIIERFGEFGVDKEFFYGKVRKIKELKPMIRELKPEYFSAHFYSVNAGTLKGIILAPCYIDRKDPKEMEHDIDYFRKTGFTTSNALKEANHHNINSIAFPVLMAGASGGNLETIIPSMIDQIEKFGRLNQKPKEIEVYARNTPELRVYDTFVRLAKWKIEGIM